MHKLLPEQELFFWTLWNWAIFQVAAQSLSFLSKVIPKRRNCNRTGRKETGLSSSGRNTQKDGFDSTKKHFKENNSCLEMHLLLLLLPLSHCPLRSKSSITNWGASEDWGTPPFLFLLHYKTVVVCTWRNLGGNNYWLSFAVYQFPWCSMCSEWLKLFFVVHKYENKTHELSAVIAPCNSHSE